MTLVGKALGGGGSPVSAVLSTSEVRDVSRPGQHGSTFGGNPLACVVARMALRVLVEEDMIGNAERLGDHALARLRAMRSTVLREVRGCGLMLAVKLDPGAGGARPYVEALRARGVLAKETHDHTIRLSPPLMISRDDLDFGLDQLSPVPAA